LLDYFDREGFAVIKGKCTASLYFYFGRLLAACALVYCAQRNGYGVVLGRTPSFSEIRKRSAWAYCARTEMPSRTFTLERTAAL